MGSFYSFEVRDCNGNRRMYDGTSDRIIEMIREGGTLPIENGDEVMWFAVNGQIIWSVFCTGEIITAEDIIGFIA